MKDVPLETRRRIYFQDDGVTPYFGLLESPLRKLFDWLLWSITLTAEISGTNRI